MFSYMRTVVNAMPRDLRNSAEVTALAAFNNERSSRRRGSGEGKIPSLRALSFFAAFEIGESPLVDLGNSSQCADILAVLLDNGAQCLHITGQEFDIEGKRLVAFRQPLQPFIDGHIPIV